MIHGSKNIKIYQELSHFVCLFPSPLLFERIFSTNTRKSSFNTKTRSRIATTKCILYPKK